jgi:hypothetical protein
MIENANKGWKHGIPRDFRHDPYSIVAIFLSQNSHPVVERALYKKV